VAGIPWLGIYSFWKILYTILMTLMARFQDIIYSGKARQELRVASLLPQRELLKKIYKHLKL
jgi:hypothetical protein